MDTQATIESCPELAQVGSKNKRLIDTGLLHHEASLAGNSERYRRGETSHTIHVWWARRPHIAMRSLTFASVCKSSNDKSIDLMDRLANDFENEGTIEEARKAIKKGYTDTPVVLDMFGGGGTIPYESLNLGLKTYSIDNNELSVFIQKSNLEYLHSVDLEHLITTLESSGKKVLTALADMTEKIFPQRKLKNGKQTINYLWTYSYKCTSCKSHFSLSKRFPVSLKNEKNLFIKINETKKGPKFSLVNKEKNDQLSNWSRGTNRVTCPHCETEHSKISIKDCADLVAVEVIKEKTGKSFVIGKQLSDEVLTQISSMEKKLLKQLQTELPSSILPKWSGIVNPALYGIDTHADIFNPRQRVVCLALIKCLMDEYDRLVKDKGETTGKYIISVLSGLIDQVVDWNCRMASWISQNEQVGRAFCGPGISMYWDYNETDPVADGPSNLKSKLKRIIEGAKSIKKLPLKGNVTHASAQNLPFKDKMFDAIVTDPPYYDNIFYTILADNFYAWKRILLKHVEPKLFANSNTNAEKELVASSHRSGSKDKAHEDYCENLNQAIKEASRVLKDDGVLSFVYSHSSILGWEAIVRTFRYSPLYFTSVQPLSIERKQRPRAMKSEAVNTCIAFVARNSKESKSPISFTSLKTQFKKILRGKFASSLKLAGWCDEDISIALMAQGVALISNSLHVENTDDIAALLAIESLVREDFPDFKLNKRKSI